MLSEEEIARILKKFKCGDGNLTDTDIEYSSESESDSEIFPTTLSVDFAGIDNSDDSDSSEDNRTVRLRPPRKNDVPTLVDTLDETSYDAL